MMSNRRSHFPALLVTLPLALTACLPEPGPEKLAMTWVLARHVTPNASHTYALVGSDGFTDAYEGDTHTRQFLPVLCIHKNGVPHPGTEVIGPLSWTSGGSARKTWSGGTLALSRPVQGSLLTSRSEADALCASQFGPGYRMAEFHDGDEGYPSGWDFWDEVRGADLAPFQNTRFWVSIDDQNANPWEQEPVVYY
jgi:hypothetical protein